MSGDFQLLFKLRFSVFRGVWLCDGRAADSRRVCSQSRCQDYEKWVDSKSTQQSLQWIPSSLEHRAFDKQPPGSKIYKCSGQKSQFSSENGQSQLLENIGRRESFTPYDFFNIFFSKLNYGGTLVEKFKQPQWLKMLTCMNSQLNKSRESKGLLK